MKISIKIAIKISKLMLLVLALPASGVWAQDSEKPDFSGLYMPTADFSRMIMFPMMGPPYTEWAENLVNDFNSKFDAIEDQPGSHCVPPGMPNAMAFPAPFPMEIIQRENDITLFFEAHSQYRKIYIEGYERPEPVLASRMGYSVGHWEGDTLVVKTTYLKEETLGSTIISDEGEITERITLEIDANGVRRLVDDIVYSDPKAYSTDIVMRGVWDSSPGTPIMEYVCGEYLYENYLQSKLSEE